jgi:hypothetical protein
MAEDAKNIEEKAPSADRILMSKINQRSDSAQEIITHKPDLLERWGTTIFLVILLGLAFMSWFVNFPDTVEAPVKLVAENSAKHINSAQGGRITLLKFNNDRVGKNDVIGVLENSADYKEVLALETKVNDFISRLNQGNNARFSDLFSTRYARLGEIEPSFQLFFFTWKDSPEKKAGEFYRSLQQLNETINQWSNKYLIKAPIEGIVVFSRPIQSNSILRSDQIIGYVKPEKNIFFAEVDLSKANIAKVDTGLDVQIRLNAYPYHEYGILTGKITYISDVIIDSGVTAVIKLDHPIDTHLSSIRLREGLNGEAIVIIRNNRLFQKICGQVAKTFMK